MGFTFGRIIRSEFQRDFFHLRIQVDVQKPLRKGIFVLGDSKIKSWVSFKNENLPTFWFKYGKMGHGFQSCELVTSEEKERPVDDFPFSMALRAESCSVAREIFQFNSLINKSMPQCQYTGVEDDVRGVGSFPGSDTIVEKDIGLSESSFTKLNEEDTAVKMNSSVVGRSVELGGVSGIPKNSTQLDVNRNSVGLKDGLSKVDEFITHGGDLDKFVFNLDSTTGMMQGNFNWDSFK